MNSAVKTTVESALVALFAAGCCLWFLVSAANLDEPPVARIVLLAIGLAICLAAHWAFMAVVLKRSGRSLLLWLPLVVIFVPVGSAVLLAILFAEDKPQQA